jgi:hypothetical protein
VQAACHRVHQDIWLEKLELRLSAPETERRGAHIDGAAFDLEQLFAGHVDAAATLAEAEKLVANIALRLPGGLGAEALPLDETAESLMDAARQLLLARGRGQQ